MKKFILTLGLIFIFAVTACEAVIVDGAVRGKKGFSYSNIVYGFDSLTVTIKNSSKYNRDFGGTMLFLDKNYKVIASAELMNAKIKRHSSRKYKAFFTEGTGDDARHARYLEWNF